VGVDSAERVVQQVDVDVGVHGPGETDPLLLPAGQVDALLADLGRVSGRHDVKVNDEGTGLDDLVVELLVVVLAEEDVLAGCLVLDPGLLGHVELVHLAEKAREETGLA